MSWGILSSHPAAVLAMARGVGGELINFDYTNYFSSTI